MCRIGCCTDVWHITLESVCARSRRWLGQCTALTDGTCAPTAVVACLQTTKECQLATMCIRHASFLVLQFSEICFCRPCAADVMLRSAACLTLCTDFAIDVHAFGAGYSHHHPSVRCMVVAVIFTRTAAVLNMKDLASKSAHRVLWCSLSNYLVLVPGNAFTLL